MKYDLMDLLNHCHGNEVEINGKWMPARPVGNGILNRIKSA